MIPLAWIYGFIQGVRNFLFDKGCISGKKAGLKTIVIGNLSVGGTGKTPHVIWLGKELINRGYSICILSRGYGRSTRGFRWVNSSDHPDIVGDEPLEIKIAIPEIPVAVDGNRHRALSIIQNEIIPAPDFVILDDGFQHRSLIPHFSIILSSVNRPFFTDLIMPAGSLREAANSIKRADYLIITDTTENNDEIEKSWAFISGVKNPEKISSSSYMYENIIPLFKGKKDIQKDKIDSILLVSGIANPDTILSELKTKATIHILRYRDHHKYTRKDIKTIISNFSRLEGEDKILLTTMKDAMKLKHFDQLKELPVYVLNRKVVMDEKKMNKLFEIILNYG